MTKLEELTTLLVDEINDFNKGIDKLEKINEQLKNTKIKMDFSEYKSINEAHQQKIADHLKSIERFESRFENKIKAAKIYPTWAVAAFIIALLIAISSILYILV
ncbi:DUF6730 family protein [Algibacter sp. AS12]|uniref:DUF6730 family protein n=1 Tax=Algibacter sp. AS12 TaxID=3135773 RepID=UPI00398AE674